ncbi:MAG TPA: thioesterase [Sulfurimonas sp. UBA12504]|nr:MAG: thioesterase [Sulfurimonas sp. GWF2_37_8]DAB30447.1 MAG TPA: thioesterase [Sulfurimonas sp. UBA12504]
MRLIQESEEDEFEIHDYKSDKEVVLLNTHDQINQALSGEIIVMEAGYVEVLLTTLPEMLADNIGLVHGGFIFSAADYAAMAAVNEPNVVLVASDCQFLSPVKIRDEVLFKAKVRHKEGKKRNVHVEGYVYDIKVFEGEFKTVITEKHVLRLHLLEEEK